MRIIPIVLAYILVLITSCEKERFEYQNEYEKSYQAWLNFKNESGNNYTYTTSISSWVGWTTQTTITVETGTVVSRTFRFSQIGSHIIPEEGWDEETASIAFKSIGYSDEEIERLQREDFIDGLQWKEDTETLGANEGGGSIWTLDEVYRRAKNDWLKKRGDANFYFKSDNNGMISSCGYVENNCADDCFRGITIIAINKFAN